MICKIVEKPSSLLCEGNQPKEAIAKSEEIELLRLKYEKLQYIEEKEKERNKVVENKASMFIGSTSIMGAIIIGCSNLVLNSHKSDSHVNICILMFMVILIYCLGRSITYSILTLRKRSFWSLGIDDLQGIANKEGYYKKLIGCTIKIIKHNESVINSKVDTMQRAQDSFVDFWIWSGIFFVNLFIYHMFYVYGISLDTHFNVLLILTLSVIGYLIVSNMISRHIQPDKNESLDVENEIRSVCSMTFFHS